VGGRDPLRVPAQIWDREDVAEALQARDIGRLFRLLRQYCGASQTRIGAAVGMTQSTVSLIINRDQAVSSIAVLERLADGLAMPDGGRLRLGLAPKEVDAMRRRTALSIGLLGALSPTSLTSVLRESAAEAFEFTRERAVTTVGKGTLEQLTSVVIELDRAYPWRPAAELFPVARVFRQRVEELINGKHTLAEARELYVLGAYLSHILADLAWDLGSTLTAKAFAIDSQQLALEAGHGELYGWATDTLTGVLHWTGRPGESIDAALIGLRQVPRHHPLAARLRSTAAQGHARRGDRDACLEMLTAAREVCEQLPDVLPSRFTTDSAEHVTYTVSSHAASCYVDLGAWKDAEREARTACAVGRWSPGRAAYAQLDLAVALANLGCPDEAAERGKQALAFDRGYGSLLPKARKLDRALRSRYPKEPGALEFRARYEAVAGGAAPQ